MKNTPVAMSYEIGEGEEWKINRSGFEKRK